MSKSVLRNRSVPKSILHCHYSGIVRNATLLDYLIRKENIKLNKRHSVYFSSGEVSDDERNELRKKIENIYMRKDENDDMFKIVGNLWYYVIKDIAFLKKYNKLIIQEMEIQGVNYIEFRIKLGSHFYRRGKRVSIEKELLAFNEVLHLYAEKNVSFKMICQISKSSNKEDVFAYFSEILRVSKKHPEINEIISGFDITGDEVNGNPLSFYKEVVERLMRDHGEDMKPFFFHAGECDSKKCRDNVKFALRYGGNRIAHGIYSIRDPKLVNQLLKKKVLLEIAPLSNFYLGHLKDPFIFHTLYKHGVKMCINTDDPNKLNDSSLAENEEFLLRHGFTREQLDEMYLNALKYI